MRPRHSDLLPIAHSATLAGMLAANFWAAIFWPMVCLVTVPLAAIALTCALSAVHECAHGTYLSSRMANRIFGRIWSLSILMNFSLYRREHIQHHVHFGTEKDSEPRIHIATRPSLLKAIVLNPHIVGHWREAFSALVARPHGMAIDTVALFSTMAFLAVLVWHAPEAAILGFVIPFGLSTVMDNLVSLPEHATFGRQLPERSPIRRSVGSGPLLGFFLYWVNQHSEHHSTASSCGQVEDAPQQMLRPISYWSFYRWCLGVLRS